MKANEFLSVIKSECKEHELCNESCPFYISDRCHEAHCRISIVAGSNPMNIDFEEPTVTTTETIELPAKFDSIPNLKFKAENVYININGGED